MGMTIKRLELRNFSVFDETMDNVFTASTIGHLVAFLNLCGLQSFTSTLKI